MVPYPRDLGWGRCRQRGEPATGPGPPHPQPPKVRTTRAPEGELANNPQRPRTDPAIPASPATPARDGPSAEAPHRSLIQTAGTVRSAEPEGAQLFSDRQAPVAGGIAAPGACLRQQHEPGNRGLPAFVVSVQHIDRDTAPGFCRPRYLLVQGGLGIPERGLPEAGPAGADQQVPLLQRECPRLRSAILVLLAAALTATNVAPARTSVPAAVPMSASVTQAVM
jgi:hypothetical protein